MKDFPAFDSHDDRQRLTVFVVWVRDFLGELVEDEPTILRQDLFYARLIPYMREAWSEVRQEFDPVIASTESLGDDRILRHGLGGFQLRFKLETIRELFRSYKRVASRRALRKLLDAIDTLLESLLDALGAGSALSEFKDTVRNAIKADVAS